MKTKPRSTIRPILTARATALALACTAAWHSPAHGQITQQWLTQWGTPTSDSAWGVAVDAAGTTWVAGHTDGALGGPNGGSEALFLTPLSTTGVLGTSVQRGGSLSDTGYGVAVVGGSTVFGVGGTNSPIWDGAPAIGDYDALAVRYSTAGAWQGTTRFGSTGRDVAVGAAGNATHLLLAGHSSGTVDGQTGFGFTDAFLSKRTSTGALVWTRVVGSNLPEYSTGAAFDSAGNAYLAGYTAGSLPTFTNAGSYDFFVARYDANGTQTLLRQWGTSGNDQIADVAADGSGNIYLTGFTTGALDGQTNGGSSDAFLTKLNPSGTVLWTRLLGGTGSDESRGLALDAAGRVWIGGITTGSFAGHNIAGTSDGFVASYDSDGTLLGTFFFGGADSDVLNDLAAAPDGTMRVSGYTNGTVGAASAGSFDAWAASLTIVPEPTTAALLIGGGALLARRRRSPAGA